MKKNILLFGFFVLLCFSINAQVQIQWQKCLGGTWDDDWCKIQLTSDGGYIAAGTTYSNDGDVSENNGHGDIWVIKLDALSNIQWQKSLGGSGHEFARSIQQTSDGGYVVTGFTVSNDGDVSGNNGAYDIWVVKLNISGSMQWQKCIGGSSHDNAQSIIQTSDGGYLIAGLTYSNDGDVSGNHGDEDAYVVKLDTIGNIVWQKCYGGTLSDYANSIKQTTDGGYIFSGYTSSNNGDVSGIHDSSDIWVVKIDTSGTIQWQKCLGGTNNEEGYPEILQTYDGGYIISGQTRSNDGDVSGFHGSLDAWVVKLNATGIIQWQKCLGGTNYDYATSIEQTSDSGYILCGDSYSNDGDVSGNHGTKDLWTVKLDSNGTIQWQKCFGGTSYDGANSIHQTTDGGYIVAGATASTDGDVTENHGYADLWIIKFINPNISGFVFSDDNHNGVHDSLEQGLAGQLVKLEPGPYYTFTNNEGYYYFEANTGSHIVSYVPMANWSATGNLLYQFTLDSITQNIDSLDFAVMPITGVHDMAVYLTGSNTHAGFVTHYWLTYKNMGSITTSGTINFHYDSLLTFISSTINPDAQSNNTLSWNYSPIGAGVQHTFKVDFLVPGIQYIGDTLSGNVWITPVFPDTNTINNYDTIIQVIRSSYDPNVKSVTPLGHGAEGYVLHGQRLSYTIDFQNTGTDTATTVVLRDTLNSNMNIETFLVEAYSHPVTWTLHSGNELMFTFQNILLPDSNVNEPLSHGFIRYSIAPKTGLADYTKVSNTAYIFFDYNPAIITNTVLNTYVTAIPLNDNVPQLSIDKQNITIYPNPTNDALNIIIPFEGNKDVIITNILGQTLTQYSTQEKQLSFNLSWLNKGMYFINVKTENDNFVKKFVKK